MKFLGQKLLQNLVLQCMTLLTGIYSGKKIKSVLHHDPQKFIRQITMFLGGLMFLGVLNDNSKS